MLSRYNSSLLKEVVFSESVCWNHPLQRLAWGNQTAVRGHPGRNRNGLSQCKHLGLHRVTTRVSCEYLLVTSTCIDTTSKWL
jgi:hypothetical protein